jgi:transcriptional regulator of nitric oxide reductase
LEFAFPGSDRLESRTYVLTPEQVEAVEGLAKSRLPTKIVTIHTGWRSEELLGYAFLDVHTVRTLAEAFLVVLDPQGDVRTLRVLAFHEPLEYLPTPRWYEQFAGKSSSARLRLGQDIHGIVGATLSARAATQGVRRALAFHRVLVHQSE